MSILKKLRFIFNKRQKVQIYILIVMIFIGALLELLGVTAILPFINIAMDPDTIYENELLLYMYNLFGSQNANHFLAILAIALVLIYIIKNSYLIIMNYCIFRFTYNGQRNTAYTLLKSYLKQPYVFFLHHNSADLLRNIRVDISMLYDTVLSSMSLGAESIVCFFLLAYLMYTDKTITIGLSTLLGVFLIFFVKVFKKKLKESGDKERKYQGKMNQWLMQAFGGIKETKIAEKEKFFYENYYREHNGYARNHCIYQTLSYAPKPMMETLCFGAVLLVIAVKLMNNVSSEYFISTMSVFAVAALRLLPAFNKITGYVSRIMFNRVGIDAVYDDLMLIENIKKNNPYLLVDKNRSLAFDKEIRIENLSFRYPDTEEYVLKDINFSIVKNKSTALVGPSGAGKTTLVDIVLGVLKSESGRILVDGVDIRDNMRAWHEKIGYIPQTIYLLDDTIEKNIAYALYEKEIDYEKLNRAIDEAQLRSFIDSLEHGIYTVIGEGGVRLSGGQRQRIGIARALYSNPEVLVLDEATSALDNETEMAVMDAINSFAGKKTLIIIAHRLSTIESCDYKYEVKNQQVVPVEK